MGYRNLHLPIISGYRDDAAARDAARDASCGRWLLRLALYGRPSDRAEPAMRSFLIAERRWLVAAGAAFNGPPLVCALRLPSRRGADVVGPVGLEPTTNGL